MHAAHEIREALSQVAQLRQSACSAEPLGLALLAVKQLQAQRFVGTYADLLANPTFAPSARFFLEELYSAKDYSERDAQFSRIAGALERTFPASVIATVLTLTRLHLQTEQLDLAMAQQWRDGDAQLSPAARYLLAWRWVNQRAARQWQLASVLEIGQTLGHLTRKPGLRLLLKMMRGPAELAGLGALHGFLESGFDHFSGMAKSGNVNTFLDIIAQRESGWITRLSDASFVTCETELTRTLGFAPRKDG